MGKPKDYEADAPKGYTEHIKYDRKVYPGPTKKEMEKYFKDNYAKGVALAKESEHEKILYVPEFHSKKRDPKKVTMIYKSRNPDGSLRPYTSKDTA